MARLWTQRCTFDEQDHQDISIPCGTIEEAHSALLSIAIAADVGLATIARATGSNNDQVLAGVKKILQALSITLGTG